MEKQQITLEDLERFAWRMAQAIPDLDCPECCECGWKYQYMERSAALYREEWEWQCLAGAMYAYRKGKRTAPP